MNSFVSQVQNSDGKDMETNPSFQILKSYSWVKWYRREFVIYIDW